MTTAQRSLCVFCGSQSGNNPAFTAAAIDLGRTLANAKVSLIYGGGGRGLMGEIARAAMGAGGEVIGIMPRFLRALEVQQDGLSQLILTDTLTERKVLMSELSTAIAVLPGGFGTLDEATEIISWRNLAVFHKPVVFVDIADYWAPFFALMDHMVESNFAAPAIKAHYRVVQDTADVLAAANLA